jgi:hypothetical protein
MNTPSDDTAIKIDRTLKTLAEGTGYSFPKLINSPMLDLLPEAWSPERKAAACDELIRQYAPSISRRNHAAAVEAALDLRSEYQLPTLKSRLIAFRRRWEREHPSTPPRPNQVNLDDENQTWGATRKWWDGGRDSLVSLLTHEIERRKQTGQWPEPNSQSVERIEAALQGDRLPEVTHAQHIRGYVSIAAVLLLLTALGLSLYFVLRPSHKAAATGVPYATRIEGRYDGYDPKGKDAPGTRCADPPPSQPITQVQPSLVGPDGKVVGNVELRTSPICPVLWARVNWLKGTYVIPSGWTLHIQMHRSIHPKTIDYPAYTGAAYIYGNMLVALSGCVYAKVFFSNGARQTHPATTPCLTVK